MHHAVPGDGAGSSADSRTYRPVFCQSMESKNFVVESFSAVQSEQSIRQCLLGGSLCGSKKAYDFIVAKGI